MSHTAYEPIDLDLDLDSPSSGPETLPSVYSVPLPPASRERVRFSEAEQLESTDVEWADDIDDAARVFAEVEAATSAETPDAKRRETVRAATPEPSLGPGSPISVRIPRLREVVAIVSLTVRRPRAAPERSRFEPSRS